MEKQKQAQQHAGENPEIEKQIDSAMEKIIQETIGEEISKEEAVREAVSAKEEAGKEENKPETAKNLPKHDLTVTVNHSTVVLSGKSGYTFVDIFDFYDFDLTASAGRAIITKLNGQQAQYSAVLSEGDQIELRWQEINR